MIDAAVLAKLKATSGVTALVSNRIYIDDLPIKPTFPAITIHPVSDVPDTFIGKLSTARVQVSCWDNPPYVETSGEPRRSPHVVETVAAAVRAALHKPKFNMDPELWVSGEFSFHVSSSRVTGGVRTIKDPSGWYHIPVDVVLTYSEV